MTQFDTKSIVRHFGGIRMLHDILYNEGFYVERKTVQKWTERNNIPAGAIASIASHCVKAGIPFNVCDFLMVDS